MGSYIEWGEGYRTHLPLHGSVTRFHSLSLFHLALIFRGYGTNGVALGRIAGRGCVGSERAFSPAVKSSVDPPGTQTMTKANVATSHVPSLPIRFGLNSSHNVCHSLLSSRRSCGTTMHRNQGQAGSLDRHSSKTSQLNIDSRPAVSLIRGKN
jgi:hypothetical protein